MNGHCSTCPIEKDCAYEYKPCDCRDQLKFKPMPQPAQQQHSCYCSNCEALSKELAAQRTWVGLTNKDVYECEPKTDWYDSVAFAQAIEARLKELNT